jgi:hypothetical protein
MELSQMVDKDIAIAIYSFAVLAMFIIGGITIKK